MMGCGGPGAPSPGCGREKGRDRRSRSEGSHSREHSSQRVIHTYAPGVILTDAENFKEVVQKLTGCSSKSSTGCDDSVTTKRPRSLDEPTNPRRTPSTSMRSTFECPAVTPRLRIPKSGLQLNADLDRDLSMDPKLNWVDQACSRLYPGVSFGHQQPATAAECPPGCNSSAQWAFADLEPSVNTAPAFNWMHMYPPLIQCGAGYNDLAVYAMQGDYMERIPFSWCSDKCVCNELLAQEESPESLLDEQMMSIAAIQGPDCTDARCSDCLVLDCYDDLPINAVQGDYMEESPESPLDAQMFIATIQGPHCTDARSSDFFLVDQYHRVSPFRRSSYETDELLGFPRGPVNAAALA